MTASTTRYYAIVLRVTLINASARARGLGTTRLGSIFTFTQPVRVIFSDCTSTQYIYCRPDNGTVASRHHETYRKLRHEARHT